MKDRPMEPLTSELAENIEPAWHDPRRGFGLEPNVMVRGFRSLAALALRCWLRVYDRLTIVGGHHLPVNRSFILVANHTSHLDTLCLLAALPFRKLHQAFPVAARDYFCMDPLRAFFAKVLVNVLPFDRHVVPWHGLSLCAHLLHIPGNILILFPEGTRTSGPEPGEFKRGVGFLAAGHDIPVVPCHLAGTETALPKGARWPRPKSVRLTIGAPRLYAHLPATKDSWTHISRDLRDAVMLLGHTKTEA
jgi:1-acyl-sn-glycerol-3-phosphate acyltransferase